MGIAKEKFGKMETGEEIFLFTLRNKNGVEARITNFGAVIVNLFVPDKDGKAEDIVLGFDKLEDYFNNPSFFGAVIGPNANRIGGAAFELEGKEYHLSVNDGSNNLHSDIDNGYHKRPWTVEEEGENSLTLALEGKDGDLGFPGNKKVTVTYALTDDNELKLHYKATADRNTLINLTNHTYFNLAGHDSGSIEGQLLKLNASCYTPVLPGAIPTGEIAPVAGTPLDFTQMKEIGKEIGADWEQLKLVQVFSDLPGVQFYAGNCIVKQDGKGGVTYMPRTGFCLETQYFPDNIHHPEFSQAVFGPDRVYETETIYQFV